MSNEWKISTSLAVAGIMLIFIAIPSMFFAITTPQGEIIQLATPRYGHAECRQDVELQEPQAQDISAIGNSLIRCPSDITDRCDVYIDAIDNSEGSSFTSTDNDNAFYYQICDINGNNCDSEKVIGVWADMKNKVNEASIQEKRLMSIDSTKSIKISYYDSTFTFSAGTGNKDRLISGGKFRITYFRKYLFIQNSYGEAFSGAQLSQPISGKDQQQFGCDLTKWYTPATGGFFGVIISDTGINALPSDQSKKISDVSEKVGAVNNWVERWELDNAFDTQLVNIGNERLFCKSPGALYSLAEATYQIGGVTKSYVYPDRFIRASECCYGMSTLTKVCQLVGDTLKYVESKPTERTCTSDLDCPGGGYAFIPTSGSSESTYVCKSGTCEIGQTRTVECNLVKPCPSGFSCNLGKCESPIPGPDPNLPNNNCESGFRYVEKETISCSGSILCDLGLTSPTVTKERQCVQEFNLLPFLIGAGLIIVALLIVLFTQMNKRRR